MWHTPFCAFSCFEFAVRDTECPSSNKRLEDLCSSAPLIPTMSLFSGRCRCTLMHADPHTMAIEMTRNSMSSRLTLASFGKPDHWTGKSQLDATHSLPAVERLTISVMFQHYLHVIAQSCMMCDYHLFHPHITGDLNHQVRDLPLVMSLTRRGSSGFYRGLNNVSSKW